MQMSTTEAEIHLQDEGPNKNTYTPTKGNAVLVCIQGSEEDFLRWLQSPGLRSSRGPTTPEKWPMEQPLELLSNRVACT